MTSYLFLADGFEEIEALTVVDVMRRAGLDLTTVSISNSLTITGAHAIPVVADILLAGADFSDADWLICPGGLPGAQYLAECKPLRRLLLDHAAAHGHIAAICAAPAMVLGSLGLLDGRDATGYPGTEQLVPAANWLPRRVVATTEGIITANGPSSALPFALAIVETTLGSQAAKTVADAMLV